VVAVALIAAWRATATGPRNLRSGILRAMPVFVVGFVGMAMLRSTGVIDATMADVLAEIAAVCVLLALAAVGLSTRIGELRSIGLRPMLLGLVLGTVLAALAATAVTTFGIGTG
jgi:uncharacterized membrane protein YadS